MLRTVHCVPRAVGALRFPAVRALMVESEQLCDRLATGLSSVCCCSYSTANGSTAKRRKLLAKGGAQSRMPAASARASLGLSQPLAPTAPTATTAPPAPQSLPEPEVAAFKRTVKRVKTPAVSAVPAVPEDPDAIWMIVGLGNPGATYDNTRHNVGFRVVDELARAEGIDMRKLEKGAVVGRGVVNGRQVLLVKPITFMNNSGEATAAISKFYRVPSCRVLVVADDLDLPTAQLRLKAKGGHGGHNGLRSIVERMGGTQDFPRLKIGIGRPPGQMAVADYVLQSFSRAEAAEVGVAVRESMDTVRAVLALGLEKALSGVRL